MITVVAVALTFGLIYTGCKKDNEDTGTAPTTTEDTTTETDNSTGESSFSEVFTSISDVCNNTAGLRSTCATITVDSTPVTGWPRTVTIDYGTGVNCSGRTGQLTVVMTGPFGTPGSIITVLDSNYHHGANRVRMGLHTINCGMLVGGHRTFNVSVAGGGVMIGTGNVSWNTTRTVTWIEGDTTADPMDDVYEITGTTTGTSRNGNTFTSSITTPLRVATSCPWIESGVITITSGSGRTRSIDFGTPGPGCDNQATITTSSGTTHVISM